MVAILSIFCRCRYLSVVRVRVTVGEAVGEFWIGAGGFFENG